MVHTEQEFLNFVWEQMQTLLTPANGIEPTTATVRAFVISAFACGRPEDVDCLSPIVLRMAEPDFKFEGWVKLRELFNGS